MYSGKPVNGLGGYTPVVGSMCQILTYSDDNFNLNHDMLAFKEGRYVLDFVTGFEHVHAEVDRKGNCEMQLLAN